MSGLMSVIMSMIKLGLMFVMMLVVMLEIGSLGTSGIIISGETSEIILNAPPRKNSDRYEFTRTNL
jgi:hypothetical protein